MVLTCFRLNFVVAQIPAIVFDIAQNKSSPTVRTVSPKCSCNISEQSFIAIVVILILDNFLRIYRERLFSDECVQSTFL